MTAKGEQGAVTEKGLRSGVRLLNYTKNVISKPENEQTFFYTPPKPLIKIEKEKEKEGGGANELWKKEAIDVLSRLTKRSATFMVTGYRVTL